jgi:hypothetical protein
MRTLWQIVEDVANGSLSRWDAYRLVRAQIRAARRQAIRQARRRSARHG